MKYFLSVLLILHLNSFAQTQQQTLFVYNVAFGGVTSGIGAIINKPKELNWKKAFLKGFWQGDIGGVLNFASKKSLYLVNKYQNNIYAWPAKILHAASNSIIENAALNEPFLQNWNIDYDLVRFDFSFDKERKFKVRLLPEALFATIVSATYGKFDLSSTLATGNIIFSMKDYLTLPNNNTAEGVTFGRATVYEDNPQSSLNKYHIIAHELVHQFQYSEYQVFNSWLKPFERKVKSKSLKNIFTKYVYLDMPYFVLPYVIAGNHRGDRFYRNFYEFEADRFATNKNVVR